MHVNCLDVPRAQGHIEDIKAKYGDASNAYRVRVLGEFPTANDETVIPLELVLGTVGRSLAPDAMAASSSSVMSQKLAVLKSQNIVRFHTLSQLRHYSAEM